MIEIIVEIIVEIQLRQIEVLDDTEWRSLEACQRLEMVLLRADSLSAKRFRRFKILESTNKKSAYKIIMRC